jgi:hypothetical protein
MQLVSLKQRIRSHNNCGVLSFNTKRMTLEVGMDLGTNGGSQTQVLMI